MNSYQKNQGKYEKHYYPRYFRNDKWKSISTYTLKGKENLDFADCSKWNDLSKSNWSFKNHFLVIFNILKKKTLFGHF